eukprot:g2505.t1
MIKQKPNPAQKKKPKKRQRRANGWKAPYNIYQKVTWVYHTVLTAFFYTTVGLYVRGWPLIVALAVYSAFLVLALVSWVFVSVIDAGNKPGPMEERFIDTFHCMNQRSKAVKRYCALCKKEVLGLDHHCPWLNTCVGRRNYIHFFNLSLCQMVDLILQLTVAFLTLTQTSVWAPGQGGAGFVAVQIVQLAVAFPLTCAYTALTLFHIYLMFLQQGTYLECLTSLSSIILIVRELSVGGH